MLPRPSSWPACGNLSTLILHSSRGIKASITYRMGGKSLGSAFRLPQLSSYRGMAERKLFQQKKKERKKTDWDRIEYGLSG